MKPSTLKPGTKVTFEYPLRFGTRTIRGTVVEPGRFTRPGEVRIQWADGYGVTNVARERITLENSND